MWLEARNRRILEGSRKLEVADVAEAWRIFRQIVLGVQYLHTQRLIHRDIKPQVRAWEAAGNRGEGGRCLCGAYAANLRRGTSVP